MEIFLILLGYICGVFGGIFVERNILKGKKKEVQVEKEDNTYSGEGMCYGMCIGMIIGAIIGNARQNIPIFMSLGMSIGMCIGMVIGCSIKKNDKDKE